MSRQVLIPQASSALHSWVSLLRANAATTRDLSGKLCADHGLTINDYEALLRLSRAEGERMRRVDLADDLLLTASGVTRLLDGLERSGYVKKGSCESDARVTYAVLTRRGRRKLEEASESHIAQVRALFEERLTSQQLDTLADLLSRLSGVGAGDDDECSPG
jgi:DNA-binding MarR family transcriptional regulator